jgi:ABC-type transport system involved in multi-copper enzyme maturation permease subunit
MLLLFVPKLVKIGPAVLWNNTIFDLQSFSVLILSIVCSIVAVVVFRDGREDGSELIVMSKPIAR